MDSPSRNLRSELLVALIVLITLAMVVIFAVVLTADSVQEAAGETVTAAALRITSTINSLSPTESPVTDTAEPSSTPGPTTATTLAATTESPTEPPVTATPTLKVVPSDPPPSTETRTASPPTTVSPPSVTPTTASPSPTRTLRPTATRTPLPATSTRPAATATVTIVLSTPMTSSPSANAHTPATCSHPTGWRAYTVQSGDNLFRIALQAGVSQITIQEANCIADASEIVAGTTIFVPTSFFNNAPTRSAPTTQPGVSQIPRQTGCTIPLVVISMPAPDAILAERFTVHGTATLDDTSTFNFYKVEIRRDDQSVFRNVSQSSMPAPGPNAELAVINPADFGPGTYQIVLTVVDDTGNYPEPCAIRVTFR